MDHWKNEADELQAALLAHPATLIQHYLETAAPEAIAAIGGERFGGLGDNAQAAVAATLSARLETGHVHHHGEDDALSDKDHNDMDAFLGYALDAYKAGHVSRADLVSKLSHVSSALSRGNFAEARMWFQQGRKFLTEK